MAHQVDGGYVGGPTGSTMKDEDYERWLMGDDELDGNQQNNTPAPAPAPAPAVQNDNGAAALERAREAQRIAELEAQVKRVQEEAAARNRAKVIPEEDPEDNLTEEEQKVIGDERVRSILNKMVRRGVRQGTKAQHEATEKRIAELESKLNEVHQTTQRESQQSRAQIFQSRIAQAVPDQSEIVSNPNFHAYLNERVNSPQGVTTRLALLQQAEQSGNADFAIAELNGFRRRFMSSEQQGQQNQRDNSFASEVQRRAASAAMNGGGASRGGPTLANLNPGKRGPNVERVKAEYERLRDKIRSGRATPQETGQYIQVQRLYVQILDK